MAANIAILAGGNSSEFQISLNSAEQVFQHIDRKLFTPYKIILRERSWTFEPGSNQDPVPVDRNDFSITIDGKKVLFDAVFIAIHGTPGEDGKMQSYFELLGIPFTGCHSFVSALTFNKFACKKYLEAFHIRTAPSLLTQTPVDSGMIRSAGINFPAFVKANSSGSSYGVTRVSDPDKLHNALKNAFKESSAVLIEEEIRGTEVTCGVLKTGKREIIFPPTEIIPHKEYFDFEAKYTPGMADEITPARLPEGQLSRIRETASAIYDYLDCRGIVRADFILCNNQLYFLEINTVPGLSRESIIPKQAKAYGITTTELYTLMLEDCMSR